MLHPVGGRKLTFDQQKNYERKRWPTNRILKAGNCRGSESSCTSSDLEIDKTPFLKQPSLKYIILL